MKDNITKERGKMGKKQKFSSGKNEGSKERNALKKKKNTYPTSKGRGEYHHVVKESNGERFKGIKQATEKEGRPIITLKRKKGTRKERGNLLRRSERHSSVRKGGEVD